MQQLLQKFCSDDNNGLMLLDMPTGIGKTYNVVQFIKEYLNNNPTKNIFFVTTLKKNLEEPFGKLQAEFENKPDLSNMMIRLQSNKDYVKDNFDKVKKDISKIYELKRSEEFKILSSMVDAGMPTEVYAEAERKFRKLVSRCLSKRFKSKEDKLYNIKNNNDWKWVGILYPVVFINEKRVFFATMKKLINQFDTLVEKSTRLYESKIFQDSIVFIDEVDATKKDIEDMIVDNGIKNSIDYLDLFRNIKICLDNQASIPNNIFDNVGNKPNHIEAFKKNINLFDEIDKEYNLSKHYKSNGFDQERLVLFSDLTHNNYTTCEKNVKATYDKKANVQRLSLVDKDESDRSLYEALDKIKGAISYFSRFIGILSRSYYLNRKKQDEQRTDGAFGEFTEYHAIDTVLDSLHLQGEALNIIRDRVISNTFKFYRSRNDHNSTLCDDVSFYSTGFSHYKFVDDYSHDNTTIIQKYAFEETPESIFYDICSHAKVIGVSATATYNTVLGNYDMCYLKWKLQDRYFNLNEEDKKRLYNTFNDNISGYNKIKWNVTQTNTNSKERPKWENVLSDEESIEHASQIASYPDKKTDKSHYNEVRYFKIALAYKQFEEHNIQSYLSLLNKAVDKGNSLSKLRYETLEEIFTLISKNLGKTFDKDMICILTSDNFENQKEELIKALSEGKRRFIISTYATLGAGQNLQFKIPLNRTDEVVKINETRGDSNEMDIDGIYLDKPTMVVNLLGEDETNNMHRVFQMEYLHQVHAISDETKFMEIKNSYDNIDNENLKCQSDFNFADLKEYKVSATKTLVQGMGRKCRTPNRGKVIYILADFEIGDILDIDTLRHEKRMFNPEMEKLVELFDLKQVTHTKDRTLEIAIEDAKRSNKRIRSLLKRCFNQIWNEEDIELWQNMREYALKHPTLSKEEWQMSPFLYHYITLGNPAKHYYFSQTGDFDSITNIAKEKFASACTVSTEEVKLSTYLNNYPQLKEHFEKKGYATDFHEDDYIMSPPFFQNIYKGALGEEIGKFLLGRMDIKLVELDAKEYEMFDYKIADKPIYVDFKYWKESTRFTVDEYHKKVIEKTKKCDNVGYVLIINVRDTGNNNVNTYPVEDFNIIEMSLIYEGKTNQNAINKIQEIYDSYSD